MAQDKKSLDFRSKDFKEVVSLTAENATKLRQLEAYFKGCSKEDLTQALCFATSDLSHKNDLDSDLVEFLLNKGAEINVGILQNGVYTNQVEVSKV
jgi:hypothetical protein